ncbi:MAG: hypothetical protein E7403_07130 [Ruminococcaceae bacterium]|nr:hypothetical protein [Oscillospiraceae bacterium]
MSSPIFYKPKTSHRILWAIAITIIVLIIILAAVFLAIWFFGNGSEVKIDSNPKVTSMDFELEPGIHYESIVSNSALFFYSAENTKVINTNGELIEETSLKMTRPVATVKGDYTIFFDLGGRNISVYNKTKLASEIALEESIILASVNENGYAVIVTKGTQHKCAVSVYSPSGEELFKWNSGNLSVVAADIAKNNKDITVAAINTDEGTIKTHIIMFNVAKEKPFTNDLYENLYSVIRYSDSYVYCIGSNETRIYNSYGKCIGTAVYENRDLLSYAFSEDYLIMAFSGSSTVMGATSEIKSYNSKGEEVGSFSCAQKFDFLSAKGNTVVLNNGRTISVLNNHCQESKQLNLGVDLKDFAFFGSQKKGVGITAAGAVLIQLKS